MTVKPMKDFVGERFAAAPSPPLNNFEKSSLFAGDVVAF